jgi:hypothetical protein
VLGAAGGTTAAANPSATKTIQSVPGVLAFTGASHLALYITVSAVLILAGLLMLGLTRRHRSST